MRTRKSSRDAAIERMADHLLCEGLAAATLRPLAAAAGTSDRMLLYYFADKDEILSVTLHRIAERMLAQLDEALPSGKPWSFRGLMKEVWPILTSRSFRPFMPLWLELASAAARGLQPHVQVVGQIADGFLAWVTSRLEVEPKGNHAASAALFLASIEGMYLLEAIGRPDLATSAGSELVSNLRTTV
ncbi:TetR family transcriptional regulator [Granulicella sibirica]|uniref:TetR family transcriptional regulator n=1 Tax=Granulicella sibirica TaxID=2479048 RepID=UPI0010091F29